MNQQHTGMERHLSPVNVWALAVGCMIGWGAFVLPGDTFLGKAGPVGTALGLGAAALMMVLIAYNYNYMINKYPVVGGAFAYTKAVFGEKHGFICAWFMSLSYLAIVPLNGTALALVSRALLHNLFQVGFHYTVAGYEVYLGEVALAAAVLILFGVLGMRGVRFHGSFDTLLVVALIVGVTVFFGAACLSPKASPENLQPWFSPHTTPVRGVLTIVAIGPWAFAGFETIPQTVEEFNFSTGKIYRIMASSVLVGALVYVTLNLATAKALPPEYGSWVDYVEQVPTLVGLPGLPTFYGAYLLLGPVGLLFIGLAVLSAILSSIIGFYMATSRLLYAMAREKVLPRWFGKVHPRYKTPANAVCFTMLASLVALPFGRTALEWIVNMSSVGASIGAMYTCLAALRYARAEHRTLVQCTALVGLGLSLLFIVLLLVPIPGLRCSLNGPAYGCMAVWIVLGLLFYRHRAESA